MNFLNKDWFSSGTIDLEYKQYTLLNYIQGVKSLFLKNKLYPSMSNLKMLKIEMDNYQTYFKTLTDSFPKDIVGIDSNGIIYQPRIKKELPELDTITQIVDYSLPIIKQTISEGKEIYSFFEDMLEIKTVGLESIDKSQGFLLVRINREVIVYSYNANLFTLKRRDLKLTEVDKFMSSLSNNVGKIKKKLEKKYKTTAPATYFVDVDIDIPLEETILPIIKRKFVSEINFD